MPHLFPLSSFGDIGRNIFARNSSEDNWITPRGSYNLINRILQNNSITGSSTSLPRWRQDVGKNPFSIFNNHKPAKSVLMLSFILANGGAVAVFIRKRWNIDLIAYVSEESSLEVTGKR